MGKRGVICFIFAFFILSMFLISLASAASVDEEIQKVTYYAQQYEAGNIGYAKLLTYTSSVREDLNGMLGATDKMMGGLLKQSQIESVLGAPSESTRWVWSESENQDKKLDSAAPIWRKIIFDGNKIQIRLSAYPNLVNKDGADSLVYRLNFDIEFKKPKDQLDVSGKINEIKGLAQDYNADPSSQNGEELAKQSVNAERTFESYLRQSAGQCEDIMKSIFGTENERQAEQLIVQEIDFYTGDKFDIVARLEMCDDCQWNYVNLNMNINRRGGGRAGEVSSGGEESAAQYKSMDVSMIKTEIASALEAFKQAADAGNWGEINRLNQKISALNEAWNQKSNDIWKQVDAEFKAKDSLLTEQQRQAMNENYGWIKQDQQRRQREKELMQQAYQDRKLFYQTLFSSYEKRETYYEQRQFEKRLVETFSAAGQEICNNNIDDNNNGQVDCQEDMCSGKICGQGEVQVIENNQTVTKTGSLYCINQACQQKEEIVVAEQAVCGNHKCEAGETAATCAEDCSACPAYPALECNGKVIFKGMDENNCSLEPVCIAEANTTCSASADCPQPLCGTAECIEGQCKVTQLESCKEAECSDGTTKVEKCDAPEGVLTITTALCEQGMWKETGVGCPVNAVVKEPATPGTEVVTGEAEIAGEVVAGNACTVKEDCGRENDVCSNGNCVSIPTAIQVEAEAPAVQETMTESGTGTGETQEETGTGGEQQAQPETSQQESSNPPESPPESSGGQESPAPEAAPEPPPATGAAIFGFLGMIFDKISVSGRAITGFIEGEMPSDSPEGQNGQNGPGDNQNLGDNQNWQNEPPMDNQNNGPMENNGPRDDQNNGPMNDRENNKEQERERCAKQCSQSCVDKCIRDGCGQQMDCNVDEVGAGCTSSCSPPEGCVDKCMSGEKDWWKEYQEQPEQQQQEKGVFSAGGTCRTSQGQTEGYLWFGGWGDPFEKIQSLKMKYYNGGEADWCKQDLENLKIQRQEFENSFNQEFATWFFEDYLANSAENWEQSVSGIFETYFKNVDNQRQMAERMRCLGMDSIDDVMGYKLINFKYESEYGSIEYWEEAKTVSIPGIEGSMKIISPYMKVWVFPSKDFMEYQMQKQMANHEFPGPPEKQVSRENQGGPTPEEKAMMQQDKSIMKAIKDIAGKYNGNMKVDIQLKDNEKNVVVFNMYAQVNENDIIKIEPMPVSETPVADVTVEIDFSLVYDMIYNQEKDMRGAMTESPPWDKQINPVQAVKNVVNGVKSYFQIRKIIGSAKVTPESSAGDVKKLVKLFMGSMSSGDRSQPQQEEKSKDNAQDGQQQGKGGMSGDIVAFAESKLSQ